MRPRHVVAISLLAPVALTAAPAAHAAAPAQPAATYAVTYTLDYTRDESDMPGRVVGIHATGATRMRQSWRGDHYSCTMDPYELTAVANGRTLRKRMPGEACDAAHDHDKGDGGAFKSMDFAHFPAHPRTHWSDDQTMTTSEAMQWPIDKSVAGLLGAVAWHTDYTSDGNTYVSSRGAGSMITDRDLEGGAVRLHAHLTGTSAMGVRALMRRGQPVASSMTMAQAAKLYVVISNTSTGASVSEHDSSRMQATATLLP